LNWRFTPGDVDRGSGVVVGQSLNRKTRVRDDVGRALQHVDAVERGVVHDRLDLLSQRDVVRLQSLAAVGAEALVRGGQSLFLHTQQQVGDGFAGRHGDVHGRDAALQRLLDGVDGLRLGALALSDGPDGAVVLGGVDLAAGVDAALNGRQFGVGGVQVLQGDHRPDIRVHAVQHG
jgi:hypothetical protein